ncbi:ABC-type multidrug transport system ATPase subunit [Microbacterium sp. SORGH_AS 1204]|uniref:ABC transporter ATP-binding protein n=1 Tax=Microbacterium sp. SORGH_AS_1204 TaxID=3041785 RepID=UPI00278DFC0B|nr:ABC transporter ATP-binding protein [Microbacterium sp. SORGH_AS_1204]MDQ1137007.1 ABC-type multidrug transport system ATPase subunit [Microbacterium sp. SORGH_AS_1204]
MTASLPDLPESSSSETEGVAASVEPAATAAPKPRSPRGTASKRPPARSQGDSEPNSGVSAEAASKPAPKPRAPRTASAARAAAGGGGRTPTTGGAARTSAAGGTARTAAAKKTAAAKRPAAPRTSAAKKPATPRDSATSATAATVAAASTDDVETPATTGAHAVAAPGSSDVMTFPESSVTDDQTSTGGGAEPVSPPTSPSGANAGDGAGGLDTSARDGDPHDAPAVAPELSNAGDGGASAPAQKDADDSASDGAADEVAAGQSDDDDAPDAVVPADVAASADDRVEAASAPHAAAAPVIAFDDIVIPPRPPLPVPGAVDAATTDDRAAEAGADPTPADVAVEQPVTVGPDTSVDDAASADVEVDKHDAGVESSPEDPTAADVAVEEPVIVGPDTAVDEPGRASDAVAVSESAEPSSSEVEVIADTPLEVDGVSRSDVRTDDEAAVESIPDDEVAGDPAPANDVHDPTPPDVRVGDAPTDAPPADAAPPTDAAPTDAPLADAAVEHSSVVDAPVVAPTAVDVPSTDAPLADAAAADTTDAADADVVDTDEHAVATRAEAAADDDAETGAAVPALTLRHITKTFGDLRAVDAIDLTVPAGSFYGLVGPNGAGKTTTLSIIAGLLRADAGDVTINGVDAKKRAREAKKLIGVLPDRLRTFDRLTGRQLLSYYGALRGLPGGLVESRMADLARAFDLVDALARPVSDYSAGMTKKVMLAGAMIHSPRLLVLDEPFEAVDPVSSGVILDILRTYVDHGGTVILSSHGMELVERVCSRVAVIVSGQVLAEGTVDEVRGEGTLEERFRELSGGLGDVEGLEWLHTFSA